jgi:hypothetical protein
MMRIPRLAIAAVFIAAPLSGCTMAGPTSGPALPTAAPAATGKFNEKLANQSAWHIRGGGKYATGSIDTCDLNLAISIEDAKVLASSDSTLPVFGMVFRDGNISYGTVWPTPEPGTGITEGTGTYTISYDSSGLPVSAHGTATVRWRDPKKTPAVSTRTDQLTLTFTKESRADHCQ